MAIVTFSEAAKALGFKSRSTLFRLKDQGDLAGYLRPPASTGGAPRLELEPPGLPPLRLHVERSIRPQVNNTDRNRRAPIDPRWAVVAQALTDALADAGGLQLAAAEAQALAAALPEALGDGFGDGGLELLRVALADAGCWRAGPCTPKNPNENREWWGDDGWGRWEPGEVLANDPFWEHVGGIVGGMMGGPFEDLSGHLAEELNRQLGEAIAAVEEGARWDRVRWDAACAQTLLDDPSVADGSCSAARLELEQLTARGLLPPELQAAATAALERYQQLEQQGATAAA